MRRVAPPVVLAAVAVLCAHAQAQQVQHVIHISVDGLRPDAIASLGPAGLPNYYRLRTQGAFTDNARSDVDFTNTLPNHVDQMTGRGVYGPAGASHQWSANSWSSGQTLHDKGPHIAGPYDVAHDNGLRTGHYASKGKFELFEESWNALNGAPDTTGPNNGTDKIDVYLNTSDTSALTSSMLADLTTAPQHYTFIHWRDPDSAGHSTGWDPTPGSGYSNSIVATDGYLGSIFNLIDTNPVYTGSTAIILTADHGGHSTTHGSLIPSDYTIPFCVWGPGVTAGADLYALNPATRQDPGTGRPLWTDPIQPIRNGDAPNLALDLLALGAVPGSGINPAQDLLVPEPATLSLLAATSLALIRRRR